MCRIWRLKSKQSGEQPVRNVYEVKLRPVITLFELIEICDEKSREEIFDKFVLRFLRQNYAK